MTATLKFTVDIEQDVPKVKLRVECPDEASAKRVEMLEDALLNKINMAVQGFHQPDLPELNDPERKGQTG